MGADLVSRFKAEQDGGQLSEAIRPRVASVARRAIQSRRGLISAIGKGCALGVRPLSVTARRPLSVAQRVGINEFPTSSIAVTGPGIAGGETVSHPTRSHRALPRSPWSSQESFGESPRDGQGFDSMRRWRVDVASGVRV